MWVGMCVYVMMFIRAMFFCIFYLIMVNGNERSEFCLFLIKQDKQAIFSFFFILT